MRDHCRAVQKVLPSLLVSYLTVLRARLSYLSLLFILLLLLLDLLQRIEAHRGDDLPSPPISVITLLDGGAD